MRCSEQDSGWLWLFVVAILVQPLIADASKMVRGNVAQAGDITDEDETTFYRAVIIQFATVEDLNAAIRSGQCRFTVFGGDV